MRRFELELLGFDFEVAGLELEGFELEDGSEVFDCVESPLAFLSSSSFCCFFSRSS